MTTIKELEHIVYLINKASNIGNYHLDGAYGGWKLVRMDNESGGIYEVTRSGFTTKNALYNELRAFLSGIESMRSDLK